MKRWAIVLALTGLLTAAQEHRFLCADYTQGKVFLVDAGGNIEWSYDDAVQLAGPQAVRQGAPHH
jgi:hypothetical protein